MAGIAEEMVAPAGGPVTPEAIERRANALAGRRAMWVLSTINRASVLGLEEFGGLPYRSGEECRARLRGLSPAEVGDAIRAAFRPAAGVWVEAR